ncbi:Uncharacterised protein [Citrobacter koseri]|uniref:Uncharacterized protein n=1 Tax=Citrobacter koseri TaxID=545 RepID=A0A2X2WIP5_CITKO|nr:Uncharacterised protein [Citrobacter koseri]
MITPRTLITSQMTGSMKRWDDRFGKPRLTWHGMEQRYKTALANLGLNPVGTFQGGAVINSAGDIIQG